MAANLAEKEIDRNSADSYRDECNFAEFPLALLDRPREGQKTVSFSDTIYDFGNKIPVTRTLTISGSDKYGLPTPRDEEVILGLIQLSHQAKFAERRVYFTRGELVRLLGWSDDGKSYRRVLESLNKWAGITLYYDKAWWSRARGCWVNQTFHVIDNLTLYDREVGASNPEDPQAGQSSFVWNETVFESFKAGYLKKLDLNFYKDLSSVIAKKVFRFLDKRFRKRKLQFDLKTFAFEHIGLSRNYHNGEIKRKLIPAILELEAKGFLEKLPIEERFIKQCSGVWSIVFIKNGPVDKELEGNLTPIEEDLVSRGVTPHVAGGLSEEFPPEKIMEKLKVHDALVKKKDPRISKNSAGWLVSAIKRDFSVNPNEGAGESSKCTPRRPVERAVTSVVEERPKTLEDVLMEQVEDKFRKWWDSHSEEERGAFEKAAVEGADAFSKKQYTEGQATKGSLFMAARRKILLGKFRAEYLR